MTRFCPACKRFREPDDFWAKHARCKPCAAAAKQARRAENPGREAELARDRRARQKFRGTLAESVLFHILRGHQAVVEEFGEDLDPERKDELSERLSELFMSAVADAEDRCGLEPGAALNALTAGQRNPPLGREAC